MIVALDWMYSNAVGGIKVVIREEDYDAAAEILDFPAEESQEAAEEVSTEPETDESPSCPACSLKTITALPKLRVFVALTILIGAVGLAMKQFDLAAVAVGIVGLAFAATPRHRCTSCGESFSWHRERPRAGELPLPQDLAEEHCPRCGSPEIHRVYYHRLKALGLFQLATMLILIAWPFLPKRKCDACGLRAY